MHNASRLKAVFLRAVDASPEAPCVTPRILPFILPFISGCNIQKLPVYAQRRNKISLPNCEFSCCVAIFHVFAKFEPLSWGGGEGGGVWCANSCTNSLDEGFFACSARKCTLVERSTLEDTREKERFLTAVNICVLFQWDTARTRAPLVFYTWASPSNTRPTYRITCRHSPTRTPTFTPW